MGAMRLLLFFLFLASHGVSSVRKFKNITDLRNTAYGKPAPRHGFQLLFWFSQQVNVDQNHNINLNFLPNTGAYGFRRYGDRQGFLKKWEDQEYRRHGRYYYEVGNLNPGRNSGVKALPSYVQTHYRNSNSQERNMDRIFVSLDDDNTNRIRNVYVTAHNPGKNDFDPDNTYEITPNLLSEIRYHCASNEEDRCSHFLKDINYGCGPFNRWKRSADTQCNTYQDIKLEIKTMTDGYTKLIWNNIPASIMNKYQYVYIEICQNTYSSGNEDPTRVIKKSFQIPHSSGVLDTNVPLNAGLQPRLKLYTSNLNYYSGTPVTWYGPEFDGANRVIPVRIKGSDAGLQLYAENRKACARLYIKKTFSDWKTVFKNSWVGFYETSQRENKDYYTYQYAVKFTLIDNTARENYDIYQYKSKWTIAPGVQIRFLLDKQYDHVLAQTTPWESHEKATSICNEGNPQPDRSSPWSFPEFFDEPGYYDANNVIPTKILGYDAGLQVFIQDGYASARLYIKKSFTNWDKTFYYSWVGFYTSSQKTNKKCSTYQYAVKFNKMEGGAKDFDIYQYKSNVPIASGVQIRFLKNKGYDEKLAETKPWTF